MRASRSALVPTTYNGTDALADEVSFAMDAGADQECSFADLGESVRKIRIDFGIPIEFDHMGIYSRTEISALKDPGHNCAIGRIRYSVVDGPAAPDGIIVYIKPACYGDEPRDITNTSKGTRPSRTRAPQTSFSPNRNSRATECLARTRCRNFAQIAAATFVVLFAKS